MTEFNLSDKIVDEVFVSVPNVKEFIRLILEEELEGKDLFIKIKKLAGPKLT